MMNFADAASEFYPVSIDYLPDPERLKLTTNIRVYEQERPLPADLRPRMRTSFTLSAWVSGATSAWIVRAQPRGMELESTLEVCWGWRYPAQLVYGFHDLVVDQPSSRLTPVNVAASPMPPLTKVLTMEAIVVNETHASFYRDAQHLSTVSLPRPVTDCADSSLLAGDSSTVRFGSLTYFPRALTPAELLEVRNDGMALLEIVAGGAPPAVQMSDSDFTLERVAVEASSGRQGRQTFGTASVLRDTRSTVALQQKIAGGEADANLEITANTATNTTSGQDDWEYVISNEGVVYSKTVFDAVNAPDPRPSGSSQFSVALFFKLQKGLTMKPAIKLNRDVAPGADLVNDDICWGIDLQSRYNKISLWARNHVPISFLDATTDASSMARSGEGIFLDCPLDSLDNGEWQHLSMVSDELKISFYHQGQLLCELDVPDASFQLLDCDGPLRLGGMVAKGEPDFNTGEMYGLRKYNVALSADEAEAVAVCVDDPAIDDVAYTDTIGNPCAYYARFLAENGYTLCTAVTERSCPIACGVKRACPNRVKADALFSRTLQFLPPVMCLTDTGSAVLEKNLASREEKYSTRRRLGHIPKVTIDNAATFVDSGRCSGGSLDNYDLNDYTIVVWTKGKNHQVEFVDGFTTLAEHESDPALDFTTYVFSAQTNVMWAANKFFDRNGFGGELRPSTGSKVTEDEWIMHALSWNSSHLCYFVNGENACTFVANYSAHRILGVYLAAVDGNSAYLHSMRMSTVRTFSPALKEPAMVRMYYNELRHYSDHISGPKTTDLQESIRAPIKMLNYAPKTINFMPPLTFQRRYPSSARKACEGFAAETAAVFESVRNSKCRGYDCSSLTGQVLECFDESKAGDITNETYFGRSPSRFNSNLVYSEFLHTFKSELLYRDGEGKLNLDTYLNSRTIDQEILALMFTPGLNTATVLTVKFDFTYAEPKASYTIEHFSGLTAEALSIALTADIVLGVLSLLLLLFSIHPFILAARRVLDLQNEHTSKRKFRRIIQVLPTALRLLVEVGLCVGLIVFAFLHAINSFQSDNQLIEYFKPALKIPWSDPEVAYDTKVGDCFSAVQDIESLLQRERMLRMYAFVLMLCCVVRLIGYMTVHPRINLLVATMVEAGDEVIHFIVSFAVIFFMLALIALAFFGNSQPDFATFNKATLNLLLMVFGEIPPNLAVQPTDFIIFFIIVYCLTSLFMLNFFLAIVIDAYGAVKQAVINQITEQSVFKDTLDVFLLGCSRKLRGWPSHHNIINGLRALPPGEHVTLSQLASVLGDGETAVNFVMYYYAYPFMAMDDENKAVVSAAVAPKEEPDTVPEEILQVQAKVQVRF